MGGEVDQNVVSSEGFTSGGSIENVQGDRRRAGGFELGAFGVRASNRGHSVAFRQQQGYRVGANDTRSTGNEYPHHCWPCCESGYSVKN